MKKHVRSLPLLILVLCCVCVGYAAQGGGRPEDRRPPPDRPSQPPRTTLRRLPERPAPRSSVEPARRVVRAAASAELTITTNPPSCAVYLNQRRIGETNANGLLNLPDLAPGRYSITIRKSGYTSAERGINIAPGRSEVVSIALSHIHNEPEMTGGDIFNPPRAISRANPPRETPPPSSPPPRETQMFHASSGRFSLEFPIIWQAFSQTADDVMVAPPDMTFMRGRRRLIMVGAMAAYWPVRDMNRLTLDHAMDWVLRTLRGGGNAYLNEVSGNRHVVQLAGVSAIQTTLTGYTQSGYTERVRVIVRPSGQGVIVMAAAAPEPDFDSYDAMFRRISESLIVSNR